MKEWQNKGGQLRSMALVLLASSSIAFLASCGGSSDSSYSVSSNNVSFAGVQGGSPPAPQSVDITVASGTVYVDTAQSGDCFTHTFALSGKATGVITIYPSSCATAGIHTGVVTVMACIYQLCQYGSPGSSSQTIQVTYNVTSAPLMTSAPEALEFAADSSNIPAAQTLNIALSGGSAAWTSVIAYGNTATGWLTVSQSTGTALPTGLTVSASVASLPKGRHTATLVFTSGSSVVRVPVSISHFDPAVNFVTPYVGRALVGDEVIIRGHGFSTVSQGVQVSFGTMAASSITVVNDTEIRARYPGLAAGSYPVTVQNSIVTLPSRARLVITDSPHYPYAVIPKPVGSIGSMVYDPERRSLYVYDGVVDYRIDAYRFNGTSWVQGSRFSFPNLSAYEPVFSPDGTELLVSFGNQLQRLNPATLQTMGSNVRTSVYPSFTNDGLGFSRQGSEMYSYDMLTQQSGPLSSRIDFSGRSSHPSPDGSKVLVCNSNFLNTDQHPIIVYNATNGSFTTSTTATQAVYRVEMDRTGSRALITVMDNQAQITATIYNGSLTALGTLPMTAQLEAAYVLAPDGRYAYVYYKSSNLIRKFDLDAPSGGGFVEVGTGTALADSPTEEGARNFPLMIISPDGETLFLGGNKNVIVMPAP